MNNYLINKHPDLLTEWDYAKDERIGININMITCGSHKKHGGHARHTGIHLKCVLKTE